MNPRHRGANLENVGLTALFEYGSFGKAIPTQG